jgi:GAF domain-containing protein
MRKESDMEKAAQNPFNRGNLVGDILEGWQSLLNLAADLLRVPEGLITRIDGPEIEVFLSSKSEGNPYPEGLKAQYPDSGFFCEWVAKNRQPKLIPDARLDSEWKDNIAVGMNMVSYLGMPIMRPDGEVFGTICFLDCRQNSHNETVFKLVDQFKRMIELSLNLLFVNEEVRRRDRMFDDLSRIFPICAYCKKVCNEEKEWVPVENYIVGISGRRASHGICPQCYAQELQNEPPQ